MKILLISLNRETEPFTAAPLGLALVAGALEAAGHEVRALDLLFSRGAREDIEEEAGRFRPGLVGLSLRNIESSTEFLLPSYKETVAALRRVTDAPIVLGGPGFSIMPRRIMEYLGVGLGVVGEGEEAAVALVRALEEGNDPALVPGVCALRDGRFVHTPAAHIDGGAMRAPAWRHFPARGYDMAGVQSKRGCSFGCVYCTYPMLEGRRLRLRPPKDVVDELQRALENGTGCPSYFVDNVFNNPKGHAEAVCDEITARGLDISWGCLASPAGLDAAMLRKMKDAGCESVEIGADSLSDRALKGLGKAFGAEDVKKAVRACREAGMLHMLFLILGGPGEDEHTLKETFDALDELRPDKVFAVAGIRVYPGTPLEARAREEGVLRADEDLLWPKFYESEILGDRLYAMAGEFFDAHPDWIYYPANGITRGTARRAAADMAWDGGAKECLDKVLSSVPALIRPIARKAVTKKAGLLAGERSLGFVTASEVRDAFLSETPRPFQGPMRESLKNLGLLDA
ncbi:MAG TPA: radical SAM protein [Nitrospirota bacterium]|nr:radical SAM protein [Nitrospirota bacterium]